LARSLQSAPSPSHHFMTGFYQHLVRAAGSCHAQVQQRCAAMRPVAISVWNKKTGAGNQN
jgi:hypothetical protein